MNDWRDHPKYALILSLIMVGWVVLLNVAFPTKKPPVTVIVEQASPQRPCGIDTFEGRAASGFSLAYSSWYGQSHHGRKTAAGAHKSKDVPKEMWRFDKDAMTCAHRYLPFGSMVLFHVNGRWALAMVTDRGPYPGPKDGPREFDVSEAVAIQLGFRYHGTAFLEAKVLR